MKWRRKKSPGLSPLHQIFSISWLSKLKQMSSSTTKTKSHSAKTKPKFKPGSPQSSSMPVCFKPPRLSNVGSRSSFNAGSSVSNRASLSEARERTEQNMNEFMAPKDDFWQFSFAIQSGESGDGNEVQFLSCESCSSNGKSAQKDVGRLPEAGKFGDMLADVRNRKLEIGLKKGRSKSVDYSLETRFDTPQWIAMKDKEVAEPELRKADQRILEEDLMFYRDHVGMKQEEKIVEPLSIRKSDRSTTKGHHKFMSLDSRNLDQINMKDNTRILNSSQKFVKDDQVIENVPSKNNKKVGGAPNSAYGNRDLHGRKIRHDPRGGAHSPRTALRMEMCKVRVVEEMKKAKKKREKQRGRAFESFAVVKCSFNPQQDFRESMLEMIRENGIRHPDDLESLLSCYLSLNSEDYHDIIVKVFREVWFDLNNDCSVSEVEERHCY
eukprot:TRINITY_DN37344_c1_g1_i1.p1 TRINITY_DN37344_c1_g1~~TRINITY_DN37344_c1_g1_i1.p1  ORF type:complete len:437 (+),score=99.98 TRINITY_DN37344_c1_g1_i1:140-1450(+)